MAPVAEFAQALGMPERPAEFDALVARLSRSHYFPTNRTPAR
jgi:hypothetical protein